MRYTKSLNIITCVHYSTGTYVHRVGTHMTHTELQRLHCRRVLVGYAVGECVAQSDRYIHSIQVRHYSSLRGMVQEGKVCNHT